MSEQIERSGLKLKLEKVQPREWVITVTAETNNKDCITVTESYLPNMFQQEGIAIALLLNRVVGYNMTEEDIPWAYDVINVQSEIFPEIQVCDIHTITEFTVKYRENDKIYSFDPNSVDLEKANSVIKKYLMEVLEYSEKEADAVLRNEWIADDEKDDEECIDTSSYYDDDDDMPFGFVTGLY